MWERENRKLYYKKGGKFPYLFLILTPGGVQGLNQSCCVAYKNSIAGSSYNHTQHSQPDIWQTLGCLSAVTNAQHVAHCLEYGKGVQFRPGVVLSTEKKTNRKQLKTATWHKRHVLTARQATTIKLWGQQDHGTSWNMRDENRGRKLEKASGNPLRPNQWSRDGLKIISSERKDNERSLNMPFQDTMPRNLLEADTATQWSKSCQWGGW